MQAIYRRGRLDGMRKVRSTSRKLLYNFGTCDVCIRRHTLRSVSSAIRNSPLQCRELLAGRAGYRKWCDMRNSLESLLVLHGVS
jgi:hypothetical protein